MNTLINSGQLEQAYEAGVLDKDRHKPLISDLGRFAKMANIPARAVLTTATDKLTSEEMGLLTQMRKMRQEGCGGYYFEGEYDVPIELKLQALCGWCLRNYCDARVFTVSEILKMIKDDDMVEPSVLIIPNFFLAKKNGGDVSTWHRRELLDLLYSRFNKQKLTILYIEDIDLMAREYGASFARHLVNQYICV